MTLTFDLVR